MNGKYVVKIGEYYYKSVFCVIGSLDIKLTYDVRTASTYDKNQAEVIAKKYGGKVFKVNLELEEA